MNIKYLIVFIGGTALLNVFKITFTRTNVFPIY